MWKHLREQHGIYETDCHKCYNCQRSYKNRSRFSRHLTRSLKCRANSEASLSTNGEDENSLKSNDKSDSHVQNQQVQSENKLYYYEQMSETEVCDNEEGITEKFFEEFLKKFFECNMIFLCKLLGHPSVNRKLAFHIFKEMNANIIKNLTDFIMIIFEKIGSTKKQTELVSDFLTQLEKKLGSINTEYKLRAKLIEDGHLSEPKISAISEEVEAVACGSVMEVRKCPVEVTTPNLAENIKLFMEIPDMLDEILGYQEKLKQKGTLCNALNGNHWHRITQHNANKILIPYFLFSDAFVSGHAISHAALETSITGIYLFFPTLPPRLRSRMENMILGMAIQTKKLKEFGNGACFEQLIKELRKIENGIIISLGEQNLKIHFVLTQIVGDNLGIKDMLNFQLSFTSLRYCRICRDENQNTKICSKENVNLLRNAENYRSDIAAKNPKLTGINGDCPFNALKLFRAYLNNAVDVHHDVFEGICHVELCSLIAYLLQTTEINLDDINEARKNQVFEKDLKNRSNADIKPFHINDTKKLPYTASQMQQLTVYFPLMMSGFEIDRNSDEWNLLLLLIEMIEMFCLPEFNQTILQKLERLIQRHHDLYVKLYGGLKPKHHHLIHYVTTIKDLGPVWQLRATHGEQKHQDLKKTMSNTTCRKNIGLTVTYKDSYQLASRALQKKSQKKPNHYGRIQGVLDPSLQLKIKDLPAFHGKDIENFKKLHHIDFDGIRIRKGQILYFQKSWGEQLFDITEVLHDGNITVLLCTELILWQYDDKRRCFIIDSQRQSETFSTYLFQDIQYLPVIKIQLRTGETAAKPYIMLEKV